MRRAALRAHGSRPAARTLLEAVAARAEAAPSAAASDETPTPEGVLIVYTFQYFL